MAVAVVDLIAVLFDLDIVDDDDGGCGILALLGLELFRDSCCCCCLCVSLLALKVGVVVILALRLILPLTTALVVLAVVL